LLSAEFFLSEYTKIDVGWGFLGELQHSPRPLAGFKGERQEEWRRGEGRIRENGEGKGGMGKEGEKEKLGEYRLGIVGGIDALGLVIRNVYN